MNISSAIELMQENLQSIFDTNHLDFLARDSGFIQRKTGRIEAVDFVQLMTVEIVEEPDISLEGLCDRLATLNPKSQMSAQALGQRINTPGAADLLSTLFCECLTDAVVPIFDAAPPQLLTPFRRILIQDSTTLRLNEKLAEPFRGCGGSGTKASLKLHAVYDFHAHQFTDVMVTPGTTPDTELGAALVDCVQPDDLVLRDLGYFSIDQLKQIEQKAAYFLSRLPKSCGIYLENAPDAQAIDIVQYLTETYPHQATVSLDIYLGKEKFPTRLVVYRLPEAVVSQRRRKAKQAARKKSRQPTKQYLSWLSFSFYVTNVPVEIWATAVIGTIYRLRWQIELIFKQWKSLLSIACLKGTSPYRIECLIYGRLSVICLIAMVYGTVCWYAWKMDFLEISADKLIKWLLRGNRLSHLVRDCNRVSLFAQLLSQLPKRLVKQNRKRKTTLNRIASGETFDQAFSVDAAEFQKAA